MGEPNQNSCQIKRICIGEDPIYCDKNPPKQMGKGIQKEEEKL